MPHADILGDKIIVQTRWNEKDLIKLVPGARWNEKQHLWTVPLTWAACVQLRAIFTDSLTVGNALAWWSYHDYEDRVAPALRLRTRTEPVDKFSEDDRLHAFQRAGVDWLNVAGSALLGDDMGCGKTIQTLELLRLAFTSIQEDSSGLPALVVSPNGVKINWGEEARTWLPGATPYVLSGGASAREKLLNAAIKDPTALVVVNFESLRLYTRLAPYGSIRLRRCTDCGGEDELVTAAKCEVHPRMLNYFKFKTVVVDEAHRTKDPKAKQTRAVWALGRMADVQRRIALTGTPIADSIDDLWSIMHFVCPEEYPVKSTFVDRYALLSWGAYGGLEVKGVNPVNREEFFKIFDPRFRRMPAKLVLPQLPPVVRSRRFIEMSPRQRTAYKGIDEGYVTRLPDGSVMVAPNDLEAQLRLIQFASATMRQDGINEKTGKPKFIMCDPSHKIDELLEVLEELGGRQVAVAAEHRQLIELTAARLSKHGYSYGLITGTQRDFERHAALQAFQSGKTQILLFTIKTGGTGLTMTAADTLIRLQRSWSMLENQQTVGRIRRIGAERHQSLHVIDIITRDTVEETVQLPRLLEKEERLEEINRDRATLMAAGLPYDDLDAEEQRILNSNLGW